MFQVQLSPFYPHHTPPSILPPFGFLHVSFLHVPWQSFPFFYPLSPPTSPLVTVSLFLISMSLAKLLTIWLPTLASLQDKLPHAFWSSCVELLSDLQKCYFLCSHHAFPHAVLCCLGYTSTHFSVWRTSAHFKTYQKCHLFCNTFLAILLLAVFSVSTAFWSLLYGSTSHIAM